MSICLNGKFVSGKLAKVSALDRAVVYGDGVFDTIAAVDGKYIWLEEKIDRLLNGCRRMEINIPWSKEKILSLCQDTLKRNHRFKYEKTRIIVTRGTTKDFINTESSEGYKPTLIIAISKNTMPDAKTLQKGVKLKTTRELRSYPEIKTVSFVPSVLGQIIARKEGFSDVLFVDPDRYILEGGRFNVFVVKKGVVLTPLKKVLKGITAKKVIKMAGGLGIRAKKTQIKLASLGSCDEMFATGTTKGILPIVQVDRVVIGNGKPGPITKKLMAQFTAMYLV